jgi:type II secretory pathway pseudopilin PulG
MTPTSSASERGFALPLTLFVVAIMTILLSAALIQVEVDRRLAESATDEVGVASLARNGLMTYLAATNVDSCDRALRPRDGDSVRINLPGGYAEVVARVARRPMGDTLSPWTYAVRSTGQLIDPSMGADPRATRTVAQYANWSSAWIDPLGAFVAANGLNRNPTSGEGQMHGADQNATTSCRVQVPLLRVSGSVPDLTGYDQDGLSPVASGCSTQACKTALANATNIDWASTINGGLVPDYNYVRTWDTSYPVILVQGNATLGSAGTSTYGWGLLIVTGDLTTTGDVTQWYGVVLVGGRIYFNAGDQYFDGMVISGLNAQLGQAVSAGTIGGNYLDIDYDSHYWRRALLPLAGFGLIRNTSIDNWATY